MSDQTTEYQVSIDTASLDKQVADVKKMLKGLDKVFDTVAKSIKSNFSTQLKGLTSNITKMLSDTKNSFKDQSKGIADSTKAMENTNKKLEESKSKVKSMANGVRDACKDISGLKAAFTSVSDGISKTTDAFKNNDIISTVMGDWSKSVKTWSMELQQQFGLNVTGLEALFNGFATVATNVSGFMDSFLSVGDTLQQVTDGVSSIKEAFGGLSDAFSGINVSTMLWVAAIGALIAALVYAWQNSDVFRNGVIDLWQNKLQPLAEWLMSGLCEAINTVVATAEWLWKEIFVPLGDCILWLSEKVLLPLATTLIDILSVAFEGLLETVSILWKNIFVPLGEFLLFFWESIIEPIAARILEIIGDELELLISKISYILSDVLKPIAEFLKDVLLSVIKTVTESIKEKIEATKKIFSGIIDFITGVFTGNWKKAWQGVKKIFSGVFDCLFSIVKKPLNLIIDMINAVIRGLNLIKFSIPDWVPFIGGKSFGININEIPHLARGGIVSSPTLALMGESGKEAVVPLENTGFVNKLASAVGSSVLAAMNMSQPQSGALLGAGGDIVLEMDGREFARVAQKYLDAENKRLGKTRIIERR